MSDTSTKNSSSSIALLDKIFLRCRGFGIEQLFLFVLFGLCVLNIFNSTSIDQNYVYVQGSSNYWDWPTHFGYISHLVSQPWTYWETKSPILNSAQNAYPYWSSFLPALLYLLSGNIFLSFKFSLFLYFLLLMVSIFLFCKRHFKTSQNFFYFTAIFLLSGSYGFKNFDILQFQNILAGKSYEEYTHTGPFFNVFVHQLMPSPGLLLGTSFLFLFLSYADIHLANHGRFSLLKTCIGLAVFSLVLTRVSLICTMGCIVYYSTVLITKLRTDRIAPILLKTICFLLPVFLWSIFFLPTFERSSLLTFSPNWIENAFKINLFEYWFSTTGALIFFGLLTGVDGEIRRSSHYLCFILFLLAHSLFQFFPYAFDNYKIFYLAYTFSIISLFKFSESRNLLQSKLFVFIFIVSCLSGFIEVFQQSIEGNNKFVLSRTDDLQSAQKLSLLCTDQENLVLTTNKHNHWANMWTGCNSLVTYSYVPWSYGFKLRGEIALRNSIYSSSFTKSELESSRIKFVLLPKLSDYPDFEQNGKLKYIRALGAETTVNSSELLKKFRIEFETADYYVLNVIAEK